MKIYEVGGCVRDRLMGKEPKDVDYVIVGATQSDVEQLLAQGFEQVGADFPVFLHPVTKDEYALARVERKVGVGYNGFTCETENVSLEQDLMRRDLTINAMARDPDTGEIIDPYNGQHDLEHGILRHVSDAFREDPVRVLRVARFSTRYKFFIADSTSNLMKEMVDSGELDHLTPERVYVEIYKTLSEQQGMEGGWFFTLLEECGASDAIFKNMGWKQPMWPSSMSYHATPVEQRFAFFFNQLSEADLRKLKFPTNVIDLCNMMSTLEFHFHRGSYVRTPEMLAMYVKMFRLTSRVDLFNKTVATLLLKHANDASQSFVRKLGLMTADLNTAVRIISNVTIDPTKKGDMDIRDYVKMIHANAIKDGMFA